MTQRITANSQSLQKVFPEIYQDLFSRCPLVCSAPGNFYWSGEYIVRYGGIAIKQNLPLRVYLGIEPTSDNKITLGTIKYYIPSKRKFDDYSAASLPTAQAVVAHVKKYLTNEQAGLRLQALFEVPPGCGLASSAALMASLSAALHIYLNKMAPELLMELAHTITSELLKNEEFNSVFNLAWELEDIVHGGSTRSSGAGPFCSLIGSVYPLIYLRQNPEPTKVSSPNFIKYWGIRMDEFFNFKSTPWPIDFGLIYSGDASETSGAISGIESFQNDIISRVKEVKKELRQFDDLQPWLSSSPFNTEDKQQMWEILMEATKVASVMVLGSFKDMFSGGLAEEAMTKLFKSLNMVQRSLSFASVSSLIIDYICLKIRREVLRLQDTYGAGTKLTGKGKHGDVLFAVAYHGLRDSIDKIIATMCNETGEDFYLDYASWLDGLEPDGVRIEQSLAHGIYSKFISRGAVQVKHIHQDGHTDSHLYSLEQFTKEKNSFDVLLDGEEHKIYLHGRALTSKELRSASTTIAILKILLASPGQSVANKDLPHSSYTEDRNELQSKIITPLAHAIQKYLRSDINLKVSGPIRNFSVTLKPGRVDFCLIEKVF